MKLVELFIPGCCCSLISALFGVGIASWTIHETNVNFYYSSLGSVYSRATAPINARIDSWSQVPFVDVTIIDATENPQGCPDSHPEELIYEVWPGITGMCDCLEREEDRDTFLYIKCEREGHTN